MTEDKFQGKVAIVTAGGGGIGRAISIGLAKQGAAVVIADRSRKKAEDVAAEIDRAGGRCLPWTMDLGQLKDLEPTVQAAIETFGRLDILINCAATLGRLKPILETTVDDWEDVLRTNLMGTVVLTQLSVRQMLAQGSGGAVVNILAIQAMMPLPTYAPYAASKSALSTFTLSLAIELSHRGIRVNGIAVGSIDTDSARELLGTAGDKASESTREMDERAATLVGRMGRPEDVARIALFLASEDADYMAGAIIPADGGRMISRKADPFLKAQESTFNKRNVGTEE